MYVQQTQRQGSRYEKINLCIQRVGLNFCPNGLWLWDDEWLRW